MKRYFLSLISLIIVGCGTEQTSQNTTTTSSLKNLNAFSSASLFIGNVDSPLACTASSPRRSGEKNPDYNCGAKALKDCDGGSVTLYWSFQCSNCGNKVLSSIIKSAACKSYIDTDPVTGQILRHYCGYAIPGIDKAPTQEEMNKECGAGVSTSNSTAN